ncbi:MAG: hypothetical protein BECKG1743F_GA0114225_112071, partial [Candidatus Kentron sp. G]
SLQQTPASYGLQNVKLKIPSFGCPDMNMLMLYRPSENKLLWWTQDFVAHQHDIDIMDESRILVFNNNHTTRATGDLIIGGNEMLGRVDIW